MSGFGGLVVGRPIHRAVGLLVIRVGIGLSMALFHGYGKVTGGPELWEKIGGNMERFGLGFAPAFWGFMAAFSEFGASILLILGVFFRPATVLLAMTMLVAASRHLSLPEGEPGAGWKGASHAIEYLIVYVGLFFTGSGRFGLDALFGGRSRQPRP